MTLFLASLVLGVCCKQPIPSCHVTDMVGCGGFLPNVAYREVFSRGLALNHPARLSTIQKTLFGTAFDDICPFFTARSHDTGGLN